MLCVLKTYSKILFYSKPIGGLLRPYQHDLLFILELLKIKHSSFLAAKLGKTNILQDSFDIVLEWCSQNKLTLNAQKTKFTSFPRKDKQPNLPPI